MHIRSVESLCHLYETTTRNIWGQNEGFIGEMEIISA